MQVTVRFFSILLSFVLLVACSPEEPNNQNVGTSNVAVRPQASSVPPIGLSLSFDNGSIPAVGTESTKLFVFIREPGKRMPLAVKHFAMEEIPSLVSFTGDRAQQVVELVARISLSGRVEKSPEDLEAIRTLVMTHPPSTHVVSFAPSAAAPVVQKPNNAEQIAPRINIQLGTDEPLPANAVVYVVAKSKRKPIPLAVRRLKVSDLPMQITLTDADSMLPSHTLSAAKRFAITAHVSLSGNASRATGDWISSSIPYRGNDETHHLEIDKEVP